MQAIDSKPKGNERTTTHERLVSDAVERWFVMGNVMRLTSQQARAAFATAKLSGEADAPAELPQAQFHILHMLSEEGELSVGDIAERHQASVPTISRMLNSLEQGGLIDRRIDPADRRAIRVSLTATGRQTHQRLIGAFSGALAQVIDPLSDSQLEDLIRAFGHLERLAGQGPSPL